MDDIKNKLINYIAEEQADIDYYYAQMENNPNCYDEYYYYIEQSRGVIATYYNKLISLGLTREEINRELAYA